MIRHAAILVVAAICLSGSTTAEGVDVVPPKNEPVDFQKYSDLLLLSFYPHTELDPELLEYAKKFTYERSLEIYTNKEVLTHFWHLYQHNRLPHDQIFSVFDHNHLKQAVALFKLFYYAPTLESFIQVAAWARVHVNEEIFVYAYSIAVLHRDDTRDLHLPEPVQIFPNYFFNSDFITAYTNRALAIYQGGHGPESYVHDPIWANYTHTYATDTRDPETSLTYFFEDVGVNTCYQYMHFVVPFWMPSDEFTICKQRGESYFLRHKWIVNRIEMERASVGLGPIEFIDWHKEIQTGYTPNMIHTNGQLFPQRKESSYIPESRNEDLEALIDYERRARDALESRQILGKDGKFVPVDNFYESFNAIINLVEGNSNSLNPNYYGSIDHLSRSILGFSPKPKDGDHHLPSALESFSTSLRDPAFYRISKKIVKHVQKTLKFVKPRSEEEVIDTHFSIKSFKVDDIFTYFETYDTVVSNVSVSDGPPYVIKARQTRLNHKNFEYFFNVKSDKNATARVRIFLGPKIDGKPTYEDFKKFYVVDYFTQDLVVGDNEFQRSSRDTPIGVSDHHNYPWVENYEKPRIAFFWPQHMLFPKGTGDGLPANFYVYITESIPSKIPSQELYDITGKKFDLDTKVYEYPLDRPMHASKLPNAVLYPIRIYHKDESQVNLTV